MQACALQSFACRHMMLLLALTLTNLQGPALLTHCLMKWTYRHTTNADPRHALLRIPCTACPPGNLQVLLCISEGLSIVRVTIYVQGLPMDLRRQRIHLTHYTIMACCATLEGARGSQRASRVPGPNHRFAFPQILLDRLPTIF